MKIIGLQSQSKYKSGILKRLYKKKNISTSMALAYNSGVININEKKYYDLYCKIKGLSEKKLDVNIKEARLKIDEILKFFLQNFYQSRFNLFYNKNDLLTKRLLNNIKFEYFSYKNSFIEKYKRLNSTVILPYLEEKIPLKDNFSPVLYHDENNLFSHPRNKIKRIIGENVSEDNDKIQKFIKLYSGKKYVDLSFLKFKISSNFSKYLNYEAKDNIEYSSNEIKKLKTLALKYDAMKIMLESQNIKSDDLENLLLNNPIRNIEINNFFNNEIIFKNVNVYDKEIKKEIPAIITFFNTDKGYRFRIYNANFEPDSLRKAYLHNLKILNLMQIKNITSKANKFLKNIKIGEVFIEKLETEILQKKYIESNLHSQKLPESLLLNNKEVFYIKNLQNYNVNKYHNITKILSEVLKQFAKQNNISVAYIEAQAFNNMKKSPASLYLKLGGNPIGITRENLLAKIKKKQLDYRENIWFEFKL